MLFLPIKKLVYIYVFFTRRKAREAAHAYKYPEPWSLSPARQNRGAAA
jgi:hypothetical protein